MERLLNSNKGARVYKSESPFIITSMYLLQLKDEDFINFEANLLQFREK